MEVEDLLHEPHRRLVRRARDQRSARRRTSRARQRAAVEAAFVIDQRPRPPRPSFCHHRLERPQRSVTNTTSKNTSSASQNRAIGTSASAAAAPRAAHAGDDHRNRDRIQQDRQQHVAAARPHQHRGEQRPDGGEPERAGDAAAPTQQQRAARTAAPGTAAPTSGTSSDLDDARAAAAIAEQLADVDGRAGRPAPASAPAASRSCRSRSNVRPSASVPENAIAIHRMPAAASSSGRPSLTKREREHQHARDARRTASCRGSRGCGPRSARSLRSTSHADRGGTAHHAATPPRSRSR